MIEIFRITFAILQLLSLLIFAQLMGVLVFFRLRSLQHLVAHVSGILVPIGLNIGFCWIVFVLRYYRSHLDDRCGGPILGALDIIVAGTAVHLLLASLAQLTIARATKQ
jgi:hypothetical protein